jgi:hypothetical protein
MATFSSELQAAQRSVAIAKHMIIEYFFIGNDDVLELVTRILTDDAVGDVDLGLRDGEQLVYALDIVLAASPYLLGGQVV